MENKPESKNLRFKPSSTPKLIPFEQPVLEECYQRRQAETTATRKLVWIASGFGLSAIAAGIAGVYALAIVGEKEHPAPESASETPAVSEQLTMNEAEGHELVQALNAVLTQYFSGQNVEDRLAVIHNPEEARESMRWWFERQPVEPEFDPKQFLNTKVEILGHHQELPLIRLTYTNRQGHDWRTYFYRDNLRFMLDWNSLVGRGDMLLSEFIARSPEEDTRLRGVIVASDHYNFGFSEEEYVAYHISNIDRSASVVAYAPRESRVVVDIHPRPEERNWRVPKKVTLVAKFLSAGNGQKPQPVISELIHHGWFPVSEIN